ncbi:MAG TPA: cytochrome d ubiquinol oxidase subunit II [Anaerolineae bacterium]|nr:cytochrome d ubiquinol oxidase subunit II [Anaerolineae bacterium]
MDLPTLWFVLIAGLLTGFFILDGADYGVGFWLPLLGKDDGERRVLLNTIGPFWDGNEVWLVGAGAALFAAFPFWYATLFSSLYIPLTLLLVALILRGVAFEFRSQVEDRRWRAFWDWAFFGGSLLPAFLWGVVMGTLGRGLPIDKDWEFAGTFWDLVSPFALFSGLTYTLLFAFHGAVYLTLKTQDDLRARAEMWVRRLSWPLLGVMLAFVAWAVLSSGIFAPLTGAGVFLIALAAGWLWWLTRQACFTGHECRALAGSGLMIALMTVVIFAGSYPYALISTLDPTWSMTVHSAAASDYTLRVLTIVVAICLPLIIAYQTWAHRVLRGRVGMGDELHY